LANEIGDDAVELCQASVKAYPEIARFRYQLGRALLASGKVNEARQAIQQAADKGYVRAVFALGSIVSSGIGTAADPEQANRFYSDASEKGDPYAMTAWGRTLFNGRGVQRDAAKGLDLLLKSAAMGHIDAMNDLASIFMEGRNGVPADPDRALAFFRAGMERQEMYSLGVLSTPKRVASAIPACKVRPPKIITKIKVVPIPAPRPTAPKPGKRTAAAIPDKPVGRTAWSGNNGDRSERGSANFGGGETTTSSTSEGTVGESSTDTNTDTESNF
jgi:hypothetical protein